MLSEIENDALTELVNIAVSGAAVRLRAMVGAEVKLTVPAVSVIDGANAVRAMEALGLVSIMAVRQSFSGRLNGETLLVFPEGSYTELVRAVLDADMAEAEIDALTADALGEIGNVLLLGFLSTIGTMLEVPSKSQSRLSRCPNPTISSAVTKIRSPCSSTSTSSSAGARCAAISDWS